MSSRTTRLGSTAALVCLAVPLLGVAPASAATVTETASSAGYFSSTGPQDTGTPAGTPANVGTQVDGVAPGHLAVAGGSGQEQKVSFLLFPGDGLQEGATVASAVVTVPLADGEGNVSASALPEKVRACAIGDEGFGGEDGAALAVAPTRKCDVFSAPGKASPDGKAYVFDVTDLARTWTEANDGLALTVAEGADTTAFQVVFQPGDAATLTYDATAPADDSAAPATTGGTGSTGGTGTATPVLTDTGSGPGTGTDSGLDAGFGSGSTPVGSSGEVPLAAALDAPALPAVEAAPGAGSPLTAPAVTAAGPQAPVAVREPSLTPSLPFWIGVVVLGGLLALVSLVLGDPEVPTAARSTSRLSRALQERQTAGTSRAAGRRTLALG